MEPVKKGHFLAKFYMTGAALLDCSGRQKTFSAANYAGSWNQHRKPAGY
jgi:hypothetical protein